MSKPVAWSFVGLLIAALFGTACTPGSIIARQLTVAPNQQPKWLTEPGRWMPPAKVTLTYNAPSPERLISLQRATVGDPPASYRFGLIQPGHYGFQASGHWETNGNRPVFRFEMHLPSTAAPPPKPIPTPRGTVFLLHGYGLSLDILFPWGIALAEAGWRCVLVDLRGHGDSGGDTISFGIREAVDLEQLLTELIRRDSVNGPVGVVGDSYGAVIGLRWAMRDSRISTMVAMAPYDRLSDAMEGLRSSYSAWVPASWVRQAARKLPALMGIAPGGLDTGPALGARTVPTLLIAGESDPVASVAAIRGLATRLGSGSRVMVLPNSGHEEIPYEFDALGQPVEDWLDQHLR